jgi:HlyD family secretion protein
MKPKDNKRNLIRWGVAVFLALLAAAAFASRWRAAMEVEAVMIDRGPVAFEIVDEGRVRVRDLFTVSAPTAGHLLRVSLRPGDAVRRGQELARLAPADPALLDARALQDAQAQVASAEARLNEAESQHRLAVAERRRAEALTTRGYAAAAAFDRAQAGEEAAAASVIARKAELARARALLAPGAEGSGAMIIRAPVDGVVLEVMQESEAVLASGAPILTLGDPDRREVVGEFLSQDAVRIPPQARAWIENWGGPPIAAEIVRVEPFARRKISALGVEEQRVNVVAAFTEAGAARQLGHGYRVDVRIALGGEADTVRVSTEALLRDASGWSVFRIVDGEALRAPIEIGDGSGGFRPVVRGLSQGDVVIRFPSARLSNGQRVRTRAR